MAFNQTSRQKDPRQLPVQLNVNIPWSLREFLINQAETEGLSLAKLVEKVILAEFGTAYELQETAIVRADTKGAGATS